MKPLLRKSIKICCNYGAGFLLFGWLAFSIGRQVACQGQLAAAGQQILESLFTPKIGLLLAAVLLVGANWWLEACKWRLLLATLGHAGILQAMTAVLAGASFAAGTPNRVGEYLGRLLYLPPAQRVRGSALHLLGNMSQLLVTLLAGGAGLLGLWRPLHALLPGVVLCLLVWVTVAACCLLGWLYVGGARAAARLARWLPASWQQSLPQVAVSRCLLFQLLGLSVLRYTVFVAQYLLVFRFFAVVVHPATLVMVMGVWFWAMALVPSVALAEAGIRGKLSVVLVGLFSANNLGIALTAWVIWLLNLVLPALAGSGLILRRRNWVPTNHDDTHIDTPAVGPATAVPPVRSA